MARYQYEGRDNTAKAVKGIMDSTSERAVALQLLKMGITPRNISLVDRQKNVSGLMTLLSMRRPSLQDLSFFTRQMYSLTRSGIPLVRALRVVGDSTKNEYLRIALTDVILSVQEGKSLSASLSQHAEVFPHLMIALVDVGENSGNLDKVFQQISTHFERDLQTRKRIKTVLRYPTFVLVVMGVAVGLINWLVIPAFSGFFNQFGAELPLPTRILIGTSDFFIHYWYLVIFGVIAIFVGLYLFVHDPKGKYVWDHWKTRIPIFGSIVLRSLLARFARTFALCAQTGVPLLAAINLIAEATDNSYVSIKIKGMRESLEHGESLTAAASNSGLFTPLVLQMLAICEETGEIDKLLQEVAGYYEQEVDYDIKRMGDVMEPFILVLIGSMVLILALGVYLPMWNLSGAMINKAGV